MKDQDFNLNDDLDADTETDSKAHSSNEKGRTGDNSETDVDDMTPEERL